MKSQGKMLRISCCLMLGISLLTCKAFAAGEEADVGSHAEAEGFFSAGFRWVDVNDMRSGAGEYEDDESSLALGIALEAFPLPHRFFVEGEYQGENDYYGDVGYAYRDLLLFRDFLIGLHHNLEHYSYDYPGEPPGIIYSERSPGDENYVNFLKNDMFLRLKAPDFPLHLSVKHRFVQRDGSIQQRFLNGYFGSLNKTAESRDITWKSNDLTLGMNSHLGPVEVEYAYNVFKFDPGSGSELYDYFPAGHPPDTYPHNVIPETESHGNTLSLHSSYTGQIVASATLSNEDNTNNYSGAESDAWRGVLDLQWIPDPVISLFFKYRHQEMDKDDPEQTVLYGEKSRVSYEVRPPVSIDIDLFSLSARYRPMGRLTLKGNYEFEMRERTEIDEWYVLPKSTDINRIGLSASARPLHNLKLKAEYKYQHSDDPAYNIEPDNSHKIRLSATYTPLPWMTALLDYKISLTKRDNLRYLNSTTVVEDGERDGRTDLALASMSFILSPKTSLTASWIYNRWKIEQDVAYSIWNSDGSGAVNPVPYYDRDSPFTDDAHTFSLSLHSRLRKDLSLNAGIRYTIAESEYLTDPSYLTVFSSRKTAETVITVALTKRVFEDWELGLECKAGFFDEDYSQENPNHQDGELYVTTFTLKRYF